MPELNLFHMHNTYSGMKRFSMGLLDVFGTVRFPWNVRLPMGLEFYLYSVDVWALELAA